MGTVRNYDYYFLRGARAFLCGKHIAAYGDPKAWQHRAVQDGDKAMRVHLFGTVCPGYDVIRRFHDSILKSGKTLTKIDSHMSTFERAQAPFVAPRRVIQLVGCKDVTDPRQPREDLCVMWVPDAEAEYWGVYLQDPTTGTFDIVADFYQKSAALEYVATQAASYSYEIDDKTTLLNRG